MDIGPLEAETFSTDFLRKLRRRGRRGVKLVISDAHEGIKAAVSKVLTSSWRRCRVQFMRKVADQMRPKTPKLAALMDDAEADVLAHMAFPAAHWTKRTSPLVLLPLHRSDWFPQFRGNACIRFTPPQRRSPRARPSGIRRADPRGTSPPGFDDAFHVTTLHRWVHFHSSLGRVQSPGRPPQQSGASHGAI
jgi:Transposase, Mutator family